MPVVYPGLIISKEQFGHNPETSLAGKVRAYERHIIKESVEIQGHTLTGKKLAAKELGIGLPTLYRKLGTV